MGTTGFRSFPLHLEARWGTRRPSEQALLPYRRSVHSTDMAISKRRIAEDYDRFWRDGWNPSDDWTKLGQKPLRMMAFGGDTHTPRTNTRPGLREWTCVGAAPETAFGGRRLRHFPSCA